MRVVAEPGGGPGITPPGPRRRADPMRFAAAYAGLVRDRRVSRLTGEPPLLQTPVLLREYREGMAQPGLPGLLLKGLAPLGRLRGYGTPLPRGRRLTAPPPQGAAISGR